jgi:hypothetical protein
MHRLDPLKGAKANPTFKSREDKGADRKRERMAGVGGARQVRQDYRAAVHNGVDKSARLNGPSQAGLKRATSVKMTKREKEAVYRPKDMASKKEKAKLLVYVSEQR